jgi:hypothetical protein
MTMLDGLIEKRWGTSINPPKLNDAEKLDNNKFKQSVRTRTSQRRLCPTSRTQSTLMFNC